MKGRGRRGSHGSLAKGRAGGPQREYERGPIPLLGCRFVLEYHCLGMGWVET